MRALQTLFLAGPDDQFPDAHALIARKRETCVAYGVNAVLAGDDAPPPARLGELQAREIYTTTLANLRRCDAVIANLTPWRGPGCDPATAFQLGFASALGKPVFAYMNVEDEDDAEYRSRVETWLGVQPDLHGTLRDGEGCAVEDLDLPEAAILWAESRRFFIVVTAEPFDNVAGLALCLDALKAYAD